MYEKLEEALQRLQLLENALKLAWVPVGRASLFDLYGHDSVAARQLILEYIEEGYRLPKENSYIGY